MLVTNDDGIDSVGIQILARHLSDAGHRVLVVAPDGDMSGTGASLGRFDPDEGIELHRVEIADAPQVEAWAVASTPAMTVMAANLGAFGEPPDVVVSGINAGLNTGRSVLHSGTVGAVLTAQNLGRSGLAVSTDVTDPWYWDTAAAIAVEVLQRLDGAPARTALNLNVPGLPRDEVKGVRWARLAPFGAVRAAVATPVGGPPAGGRLCFELEAVEYDPPPDTDLAVVKAGWAALTTLVGVVEAWPHEHDAEAAGTEQRLVPGAPLQPVHRLPDANEHRTLRRPEIGVPS